MFLWVHVSHLCIWKAPTDDPFLYVFQRGETALHMAARAGQADVVRYLLKNGAKVETKSKVRTLRLIINHCVREKKKKKTWRNSGPKVIFSSFTSAGWPDSIAHLQSAGESRHRPAAAAVRRLCQRCHHLRLHPPSPGCPRRTPRCCCHAAGERSLTLLLD